MLEMLKPGWVTDRYPKRSFNNIVTRDVGEKTRKVVTSVTGTNINDINVA